MVSVIGSSFDNGLSLYQIIQSSTQIETTDFEELISAADDSGLTDDSSSSDSVASSSGSSSSQTYDPADLNKDGTVTADEALMYMQMQMLDKMASEMGEQADNNAQMSQQHMGAGAENLNGMDNLKMKQAAGSYSAVESAFGAVSAVPQGLSISV